MHAQFVSLALEIQLPSCAAGAEKLSRSLARAGVRPYSRGHERQQQEKQPVRRPAQAAVASMDDRPFEKKLYRARTTTRRLRTGPYIRYPEAQLVAMTVQGDLDAYNELVERFQNAVRNRALAVVNDYQAAEDIAQEAFIKAYNALRELEDPNRFAGWLMTIVQHTALDFVRARREGVSLETMKEAGYEAPRDTRGLQIEKIEAQEESTRKVYLRRLQMCRELYKYMLETKEAR